MSQKVFNFQVYLSTKKWDCENAITTSMLQLYDLQSNPSVGTYKFYFTTIKNGYCLVLKKQNQQPLAIAEFDLLFLL